MGVDGPGVVQVRAVFEVAEQGLGQQDGAAGPAVDLGVGGDGDYGGTLGVQPVPGRGGRGQGRERGDRLNLRPAVLLGRDEGVHRCGGGGHVVVEQAGQRGAPAIFGIVGVGQFGGVGAEQVVEGVAACYVLGQQVGL